MTTYEMHYTGPGGYRSRKEIEADAKRRGFTHSYWASDEALGFKGVYNGDTIVVYNSTDEMDEGMQADARRCGRPIE